MEKDKIFELVQKYINSIPVILLGSGASAPYGIATMSMLAIELKKNLAGFTAPEDTECIQKFIQELDKHNDLEQALLAIKATANVEKRIQEVTWKLINQGVHDPQLPGEFQGLAVWTHGCQGDLSRLHQLLVEGLASGGDNIHPIVLCQHHVDDPGLGMALRIHRGGGCDLHPAEQVHVFFCFFVHGEHPFVF